MRFLGSLDAAAASSAVLRAGLIPRYPASPQRGPPWGPSSFGVAGAATRSRYKGQKQGRVAASVDSPGQDNQDPDMPALLAFFNLGPLEITLILGIGLIFFGGRLPEVGRTVAKGLMEFRKGLRDLKDEAGLGEISNLKNEIQDLAKNPDLSGAPDYAYKEGKETESRSHGAVKDVEFEMEGEDPYGELGEDPEPDAETSDHEEVDPDSTSGDAASGDANEASEEQDGFGGRDPVDEESPAEAESDEEGKSSEGEHPPFGYQR